MTGTDIGSKINLHLVKTEKQKTKPKEEQVLFVEYAAIKELLAPVCSVDEVLIHMFKC